MSASGRRWLCSRSCSSKLGAEALEIYEVILAENDQDLLPWILGQRPAPESLAAMIGEIGDFARARLQPQK